MDGFQQKGLSEQSKALEGFVSKDDKPPYADCPLSSTVIKSLDEDEKVLMEILKRCKKCCCRCFEWFVKSKCAVGNEDKDNAGRITQDEIWKMWGEGIDPPKSERIVIRDGKKITKKDDPQGYHKWEGRKEKISGLTADVFAASCRGRSHARSGKFRDDSFEIRYVKESDWYILAVADGAGSAKYSRKGSEIACRVSVKTIESKIRSGVFGTDFEQDCSKIRLPPFGEANDNNDVRFFCGKHLYHVLAEAAVEARKEIVREVEAMNKTPGQSVLEKDYNTTILLAVCKRLESGEWFIGSFAIGDGIIAFYSPPPAAFDIMNVGDSGEYAGETSFLTSKKVWDVSDDPNKIIKRFKAVVIPQFTALFLMTDGVSDAIFNTQSMLHDREVWDDFWKKLTKGDNPSFGKVDFRKKTAGTLLEWLGFKVPSYHDDRTLVVLLPHE